jgi:hypothetical protein
MHAEFWWGILNERGYLENPGGDGRVISNAVLQKKYWWTGLCAVTGGGLLWTRWWTFWFHKIWQALSAFQDRRCSVNIHNYMYRYRYLFILLFSRSLTFSPANTQAISTNCTKTKCNKFVNKTEVDNSNRSNLWNIVCVKYTCRPTWGNSQCMSVMHTCRLTWGNSQCMSVKHTCRPTWRNSQCMSVKHTCRPTWCNSQCMLVKHTCRPTWGNSQCMLVKHTCRPTSDHIHCTPYYQYRCLINLTVWLHTSASDTAVCWLTVLSSVIDCRLLSARLLH